MSNSKPEVFFFPNGLTMVLDERGEQIPELQGSWAKRFAEFMKSKGVDPTQFEFIMPNSMRAYLLETEHGYDWTFKKP